jgi:hypothetical protein
MAKKENSKKKKEFYRTLISRRQLWENKNTCGGKRKRRTKG